MPADALATLGASASAGMAGIDPQSQNNPSAASEELRSTRPQWVKFF